MSDLISRQKAKKKHCDICRDAYICYRDFSTCPEVKAFDLIPSVERLKGKWIPDYPSVFCSLCNGEVVLWGDVINFCPHCGAEMKYEK